MGRACAKWHGMRVGDAQPAPSPPPLRQVVWDAGGRREENDVPANVKNADDAEAVELSDELDVRANVKKQKQTRCL